MPHFSLPDWAQTQANRLASLQGRCHTARDGDALVALYERLQTLKYPLIVADDDDNTQLRAINRDALMEETTYSIIALDRANRARGSEIFKAREVCRAIINQLGAQLLQDARDGKHGLQHLLFDSISIDTIGPLYDMAYGVTLSFSLLETTSLKLDKSLWLQ